jgi:trehalose-6-phosphate synthase
MAKINQIERLSPSAKTLRAAVLVAGVIGLLAGSYAWYQVGAERRIDLEDVDRRARALAHQQSVTVSNFLSGPDAEVALLLGSRLDGFGRLLGYAVYGTDGRLLAAGKAVKDYADPVPSVVAAVVAGGSEATETIPTERLPVRVSAFRVESPEGTFRGVLLVYHDISYIDDRSTARLVRSVFWILLMTFLLTILIVAFTWLAYDRPLKDLAQWMRRLRTEDLVEAPPRGLPHDMLTSESDRLAASFRAARSTILTEARTATREDNVWTRDRLRSHVIDCLGVGTQLVVVSSREPYVHKATADGPQVSIPPSGVVTALDPVLRSCGGLWVAHGAGDADRETADAHGRLTVPPDDPRYTLRRIWLDPAEDRGFYGCANEALWPLCLLVHERPIFRTSDWEQYVRINQRYADTVLEEIGPGDAVVLVQDYQLALLPRMLKAARPNLRVLIFWHIPWPNPEIFRTCPWRVELLRGMLAADVIGFHLPIYCNNFLDSVDRMVETRLDRDHKTAELGGHIAHVLPFPISVQNWAERGVMTGDDLADRTAAIIRDHHLEGQKLLVGVDRIDYTKGLPERFRAFAHFLSKYPRHRGKVTLVQLGAPSRLHLKRYREHFDELTAYADEINRQFKIDDWQPIRLLVDQHDGPTVHAFLRLADVCVVSSLHDGMNLVSKEYVAARDDDRGTLILSEFAGAARDLPEALIINPYDSEQFADAIRFAVEMPADEQQVRMERMRRRVSENNIYRWAADLFAAVTRVGAVPDSISDLYSDPELGIPSPR